MDIKQLKKTPAYEQLRRYVAKHVDEDHRPYELGLLAKRFLARWDEHFQAVNNPRGAGISIDTAFDWARTPEGFDFWSSVQHGIEVDLRICPVGDQPAKKKGKPKPLKKVGWWVN